MLHSFDNSFSPALAQYAAGYSLFELFVSLSVLAMAVVISATGFRRPSDETKLGQWVSELASRVSEARLRAIRSGQMIGIAITDCGNETLNLRFMPDVTAEGDEICLEVGARQETLTLSPFSNSFRELHPMNRRAGYPLFDVLIASEVITMVHAVVLPRQAEFLERSASRFQKTVAAEFAYSGLSELGITRPLTIGERTKRIGSWTLCQRFDPYTGTGSSFDLMQLAIEVEDMVGKVLFRLLN